ncbi:MAG: PLP-dependent aspartate aminotransferase family protein [Acidobacteriota bacterium]|jgi:cystathionine gamma-synthase|nr:PLP-dependent aspartate aminotransferase family protein [Acidobacteriota bacterium]
MRLQTRTIHVGVDKDTAYNSVITPIYQTSTFRFTDVGVNAGYDYTRAGNPTRRALEENIASLEGGAGAVATATGMAAITTVLHLFKPGDHIVCTHDCYGGTYRLLHLYEEQFGLRLSFVNLQDQAALEAAFRPETKAVWIETPSNPLLNILDIREVARVAHGCGATAVVDNTFLSPANQRPFELGADVVVHSTTKYLNGHSDVVGGAIVAKDAGTVERLQFLANTLGQGASPFDCWLVLRGVKTLVPRMHLHEKNAAAVARFLSGHPGVRKVYYPGLATHPNHAVARRQQSGFGGMVSFEVAGGLADVHRVMRSVKVFALAESLGGVESLLEHPVSMSHASMDPALRDQAGINENLLRLSVGLEDVDDLVDDLDAALRA